MTTPTREEIERLAEHLVEPYGANITRRTRCADALLALLHDREAWENIAEQTQAARVKDIEETIPALEAALAAEREKVARLERAIKQIDAHNDGPAQYNPDIQRVLDATMDQQNG